MPLPLLSHDQLLTANFFDFRQTVLRKLPKHIWRDVIVSMTKNIADRRPNPVLHSPFELADLPP